MLEAMIKHKKLMFGTTVHLNHMPNGLTKKQQHSYAIFSDCVPQWKYYSLHQCSVSYQYSVLI